MENHLNLLKNKYKVNYFNNVAKKLNTNKLSSKEKVNIKNFYNEFGINIKNYDSHSFFSNNYNFDVKYIPESLMYIYIEPILNQTRMSTAYEDKATLNSFNDLIRVPKIFIKNIRGNYYDINDKFLSKEKIFLEDGDYIIKPSIESNQGKGVELLVVKSSILFLNEKKVDFEEIENIYNENFIIQEKIRQDGNIFHKIFPGAANTLRVISLRLPDNKYTILSIVARFGNDGCIADNPNRSGGIAVGIDLQTCNFNKNAFRNRTEKVEEHPSTGIKLDGLKVSSLNKVKEKVYLMHERLKNFDLISWDIAIDSNEEPCLIEFNTKFQEIIFHQTANGPLFKEHTSYILDRVMKKYKQINI